MAKVAPPLEEKERLYIKKLYEAAGFTVINFSQAQRAQQTKGIADLRVYDNRGRHMPFWFEVKRMQGPAFYSLYGGGTGQSADQEWFQALVERHDEMYKVGSRDEAKRHLLSIGRAV